MQYVTIYEQFRLKHIQVPKVFFTNPKYKKLSNDAKIAYALLLDRHNLSLKNGWIEKDTGRIYFVFKQDEIMDLLNIASRSTWQKIKKELVAAGLLEFKRVGLKQPNRMYIKWPDVTDDDIYKILAEERLENPSGTTEVQKMDFKKSKNRISRNPKNVLPKVQKMYPNNTESNDTESNNTESNNHHPVIEGFNQHQSNLIHEFLNTHKLDDDEKSRLLNRLRGKRFKYMKYIEKTYVTIKNEVEPKRDRLPKWAAEEREESKTLTVDEMIAMEKKLLDLGLITRDEFDEKVKEYQAQAN